jgi:hypothetical protein
MSRKKDGYGGESLKKSDLSYKSELYARRLYFDKYKIDP